jgi:hypothetical protein
MTIEPTQPPDPAAPGGDESPPGPETFQSRAHIAHTGVSDIRRRNPLGSLVVSYGVFGAVFAVFMFSRMVVQALGLPTVTLGIVWGLLGLTGLWLLGRFAVAWYRLNRAMPPNWIRSDDRFRVRGIAPGERRGALLRLGPIEDTPFEPQEFAGFFCLAPNLPMIITWVVLSLSIAVAMLLLIPSPGAFMAFAIYGAFAAGGLAVEFFWPTTIRVVPGRLDLVRRCMLWPQRARRRSFALRTARVLADLRGWSIDIEGPTHKTSTNLWIWPIRGRMELAHAVLLAAVSSSRAGQLSLEGEPLPIPPPPRSRPA